MEAKVYNNQGKEIDKVQLSDKMFGLSWNADMVLQAVHSMNLNKRVAIADTKGRGEVSGGGKKPWRQKGTGRARHGSIRSPLWVGGGVTHGPTSQKNFSRKINKKMKNKALFTVLSAKLRDGEIIFVDDLGLAEPKTKNAKAMLESLSKIKGFEKIVFRTGNRALVLTPKKEDNAIRGFRNLKSARVWEVRDLSLLDLLNYKYLVITNPKESLKVLSDRLRD